MPDQEFEYKTSELPIKYLGVPLHHSKLRKEDLQSVVDKIINKIAGRRQTTVLWWQSSAH